MRSFVVKRANIISTHILRSNNALYASQRQFGMFIDHTCTNPTDPDDPDYIDPEEIKKLAKEMEEKGIPNSAGDYTEMARQHFYHKLRTKRQATFISSKVDKYSAGANGLPDVPHKSAY